MGSWDRNMGVLAVGGLLAAAAVLLNLQRLHLGIVLAFVVLAATIFLALARFGPDRVPAEEWLRRRWHYRRSVRRYTYAQPLPQAPASPPRPRQQEPRPAPAQALPVTWEVTPSTGYGLVMVVFILAGTAFVVWLSRGGDAELAALLRLFGR